MTATTADEQATAPSARGEVFGHPSGLVVLAGTELWDRISFHGMQALLVLYMVGQLFTPGHIGHIAGFPAFRAAIESVTGHLSTQALASQIFGLYVGLVYFTPVLGGFIGDRWLGRTRTVALGALLMTAGHFCMAFDQSFLLAMLLLILGAGALRGNLIPQVGALYGRDDRRRDVGFQLYYSMVNFGAFIAPIVTGWLAQTWSWHIGFAFAGVGMLVGLIYYLAGARYVVPVAAPAAATPAEAPPPLSAHDRRTIAKLLTMVPAGALFWIAQSQVWNTYNLWVRDHVQLHLGGFTIPVPWFQSIDGLSPFICLPPMLMLWRWQAQRGREPGEFAKMAIGCAIFSAATLWLAAASWVTDASGRTPFLWAVMFHLSSNLGWLYFTPTAAGVVARLAPARVNATLVGTYLLSTFFGSVISGRLGGLYESLTPAMFWTLHAAIVGAGVLVFPLLGRVFRDDLAAAPGVALN